MQKAWHKRPVIVSVSSHGREDYNKAMLRLIDTKKEHCDDYDMFLVSVDGSKVRHNGQLIHCGSWPKTKRYGKSQSQKKNPYQFKPFAIMAAIEKGYTQIIWCDSTIKIHKSPDHLWPLVSKQGITTWNNLGFPLEEWVTDKALEWCNADASGMNQIMACCIMFDLTNPITLGIVHEWIQSSIDGCFKATTSSNPKFRESRHDQAMLSLLLNVHGIKINEYGDLAYPNYQPKEATFLNCAIE